MRRASPSGREEPRSRRRSGPRSPSRSPRRVARAAALAGLLLAASRPAGALAEESIAVVAVGEATAGPDAGLAELAHQLRAACRDRVGGVLDVPTMQARLRGQSEGATLSELDRAYGGALAVHQNGEFESALRTLQAIVADLEALPEGRDTYQQWIRANLRLAHVAAAIGRRDESDAALLRVLRIEPGLRADPDQYSPSYRRRMDELRARVAAMAQRRVTVVASGRAGSVYVDGRPSGTTPMTLLLPPGRYRIGGAAGTLRVPSFTVDLAEEDRTVVLDFETAASIRMTSGPGLALPPERRAEGLVRAAAWMDVDKLVVAARGVEGDAQFLVGTIYDVRRGALLREGSVRTVAGAAPAANVGALAAFLLTGVQQREVRALRGREGIPGPSQADETRAEQGATTEVASALHAAVAAGAGTGASAPPLDLRPVPANLEVAEPPPGPAALRQPEVAAPRGLLAPRPWMRPAAWASGGVALGFAVLAVNRKLAADDAYDRADDLLGPGGAVESAASLSRFRDLTAEGKAATRAAWISAGASILFAAGAGFLGWTSAGPGVSASF